MLDLVSSTFDVILIDTPPINIVTDATIMARMVDGVVLIIAANCTRIEKAIHAKSLLEKVDAHLLGVILNRKKIKKKQYYTDYSYLEENETSRIKKRKPCRRSKKFT